jgi:hypothetical protein
VPKTPKPKQPSKPIAPSKTIQTHHCIGVGCVFCLHMRSLPKTVADKANAVESLAAQKPVQPAQPDDRILRASIKQTRQTLEQFPHLTDAQAFALHVLADFAQFHLNPNASIVPLPEQFKKLETGFHVRVSSDEVIHSV